MNNENKYVYLSKGSANFFYLLLFQSLQQFIYPIHKLDII